MSKHSKASAHHTVGSPTRGVGVLHDAEHDPYHERRHPPEGLHCSACGAVVLKGRWVRPEHHRASDKPAASASQECPACRRMRLHDMAGSLFIDPVLMSAHRATILALAEREGAREVHDHVLERWRLSPDPAADGSGLIETTGLHLLRRLGHALEHALPAVLETHYQDDQAKAVMRLRLPPARVITSEPALIPRR